MGWGARLFLITLGVLAFGAGAAPLGLGAFAILLFLVFRRGRHAGPAKSAEAAGAPARPRRRIVVGVFFVLVALTALLSGGALSPFFFFGIGIAVFAWPMLRSWAGVARVIPVEDSVLLHERLLPFRWHAVSEVKFEPEFQAAAFSAMEGQVVLFSGKAPTVYLVTSATAVDYGRAEALIMERIRREALTLASRGALLLPLDSDTVSARFGTQLKQLKVDIGINKKTTPCLPFDVVCMNVEHGRIMAYSAFRRSEEASRAASLPRANVRPKREPLLMEIAEGLEAIGGWPSADGYSAGLASLNAFRGEPLADRVRIRGERVEFGHPDADDGVALDLTRPQLRAIARIYC